MILLTKDRVSLGRLHIGGICPLHMGGGGQLQGDKALMGGRWGTHEGGPNFDRLYHKLKSTVIVQLQLHDAIYWLRLY